MVLKPAVKFQKVAQTLGCHGIIIELLRLRSCPTLYLSHSVTKSLAASMIFCSMSTRRVLNHKIS
jgi:hypothetical protein